MSESSNNTLECAERDHLAARIRAGCLQKGWNLGDLAQQAGVSRTTLYHLERGRTLQPHFSTLARIAAALQMAPEELLASEPTTTRPPPVLDERKPRHANACQEELERRRAFDRWTNPLIAEVSADLAALFSGWNGDDWDELYSTFGTGGALTREGVVQAATHMNRKRETVEQLHVLLETHLGDVASEMIQTLYRMVRPQSLCSKDGPRVAIGATVESNRGSS